VTRQANALFDTKTINKFCKEVQITDKQRESANEWLKLLDGKKLEEERKNYFRFGQKILQDILGYSVMDIDFESDNVEFTFTDDLGKKVVCFEAKGTSTKDLFAPQSRTKKEQETPIKQTWDNMGRGYDYGICTNYQDFVLLVKDVGYYKYHKFSFQSVRNNDEKLKEFVGIFSRQRIIEKTFVKKLYDESIIAEREFTKEFYKLFHETRLMLIKEFLNNPNVDRQDAIHYAQVYLNRLIFLFFAEDHNFVPDRLFTNRILEVLKSTLISEHSKLTSDEILGLFKALDKGSKILGTFGFNGGLFEKEIPSKIFFSDLKDPVFFDDVKQQSKLSKKINVDEHSQKILEKYENSLNPIIKNLLILDSFDFTSEINVNILGHIFEQSISDLEELGEKEISKRKEEGVYYTPEYITDYICRNTIVPYLSKSNAKTVFDLVNEYLGNLSELETKLKNIKILDPACGSGAFLIKAVDVLLEIDEEIEKYKPSVMAQRGLEEFSQAKEIHNIIENNIYGVDINEESTEITKLSLFLKLAGPNRKLIGLSKNIKKGNSIVDNKTIDQRAFDWEREFPEVMQFDKFDIVIGNPPYGASLTESEQEYLNKKFNIGSTDTAQLMMVNAHKLLKDDGYHGFIVPKPFIYASNWDNIRSLFLNELMTLIDVGKVWKEVKLEQAIYILHKGTKPDHYWNGLRREEYLSATNKIDKKLFSTFGFFVSGVNETEIELGQRIFTNSEKLEKFVTNSRGAIYQKFVKETGDTVVFGGKQIQRYHTSGIYGRMNKNEIKDAKAYVHHDAILAQRMVAHILRPIDHIKITATIPKNTDFIIVDTINQIRIINNSVSPYFVLGLLNSKVINWYVYRFVVGRAIRTIQLDNPVTKRIPITVKNENEVVIKVQNLLNIGAQLSQLEEQFLDNIKATFGLEKINEKITEFYDLEPNELFKEITELGGKSLRPEENENWIKYFKQRKNDAIKLKSESKIHETELNDLFYRIFGLTANEIEIIKSTTPE